ncbi:hypothetical protein OA521_02905 [bacterium]|nr:hypothetical protein [bacterium]
MKIIKTYTGLICFIIAFPFIFLVAYYKCYYNKEYELLGYLEIFLWITSMTNQYELNKENQKNISTKNTLLLYQYDDGSVEKKLFFH